jgi:hypothetical protein
MNLRDQLKGILPEILPANPAEAIKGTELIRLVKYRLRQEYSDASLRYHFSIMCCDPRGPIAKVEQGQGYYLRRGMMGGGAPVTMTQARLGMFFETDSEVLGQALSRQQKFRAIFARDIEMSGRFPFLFESSFAPDAPYENVWKCPDGAVIDWETGDVTEQGLSLNPRQLELKRALGVSPFTASSVKLKIEVTHDSWREDFFQALSNARWGHAGDLVIAAPVADEQLVEELRQLGAEYGLGIVSYGISPDELDELRPGYDIPRMTPREFEALQQRFHPQRLSTARRRQLDWRLIQQLCADNLEFQELFQWLQRCLADGRAYTREEFAGLELSIEEGED